MSKQQKTKNAYLFLILSTILIILQNLFCSYIYVDIEKENNKRVCVEQSFAAPPVDSKENKDTSENIQNIIIENITVPSSAIPVVEEVSKISLSVPNINSSFKAYMDYRCITNKSSQQWKMQQEATTDVATGIRMYGEFYMVALGSYYAQQCGDKFIITLDSGKEFKIMIGDFKADKHTNSTHQYSRNNNIVEFIVDTPSLSPKVRQMGDISYCGFEGSITGISKIIE